VKDGKLAANIYAGNGDRAADKNLLTSTFREGYVYRLLLLAIAEFHICLDLIAGRGGLKPKYLPLA
jgi:hypothetical protein